jgi:L-alanine-DL-glutamate epimerase-like enolase superfamily enzyme
VKIEAIRPILLSAPYADSKNVEVLNHLPHGYRTTGLVEITLSGGVTGVGEGYLAVFAPQVFTAIVDLVGPALRGLPADDPGLCYRTICRVCDYWSYQGAARHVTSAVMIALVDALAKARGLPAWRLLNEHGSASPFGLYGSGGDSVDPAAMQKEIEHLRGLGIGLFKIRAGASQASKAVFVLREAGASGIEVGIDMTQNLARPSQTSDEVLRFVREVHDRSSHRICFLEEVFGPDSLGKLPELRAKIDVPITGGEIVTEAGELIERMNRGWYDWVQPDATVIGGPLETLRVFAAGGERGCRVVVHCWGSAVCQMANYHAAWAGHADLAEWPMPAYALRGVLMAAPLDIQSGRLSPSEAPGLGVSVTPDIERDFPFRPDAVYDCLPRRPFAYRDEVWAP